MNVVKPVVWMLLVIVAWAAHAEEKPEMTAQDGYDRTKGILEGWYKEDERLFSKLFVGIHEGKAVLSKEEEATVDKWRAQAPRVFAALFELAWPDAVRKPDEMNGKRLRI